jgi:ribosomal protein S18 acetylase RimI-like enzyme
LLIAIDASSPRRRAELGSWTPATCYSAIIVKALERRDLIALVLRSRPLRAVNLSAHTIGLRPQTSAERTAYRGWAIDNLAAQLTLSYRVSEGPARQHAIQQVAALLPPDREPDPDVFAFTIVRGSEPVGTVLARRETTLERPQLFLYDIVVTEPMRNQGIGRAALQLLEAFAVENAVDAIVLNVFDHNPRAQRLYAALGFQVQRVSMHKVLRISSKDI